MKKNIPIFQAIVDDHQQFCIETISIVDDPAVQSNFLLFANQKLLFADNNQRIITGVAMLANTPIYRVDEQIGEFYLVFNSDTIKKMSMSYLNSNKLVSFQHNGINVDGINLLESYQIDKCRGICPVEFRDIPDKSWIVSYYIKDDELFNIIKHDSTLNGFSIEASVNITSIPPIGTQDEIDELIDEFLK